MDRRDFMRQAAGGMALGLPASAMFAAQAHSLTLGERAPGEGIDLSGIPNFCAHEHWGSIDPIGMAAEGYRADTEAGAAPSRPAGVWDLVLDPYFGGWLQACGADPDALAQAARQPDFRSWWAAAPAAALEAMRPHLEAQLLTGAFQCIRRGVRLLHGVDLAGFEAMEWMRADRLIANAYEDIFAWYRKAMGEAGFSQLIRPVHPEYYLRETDQAEAERAFTRTLVRIDGLVELWKTESPRRAALAEWLGVEPVDAASWRALLTKLFDRAAAKGCVGIKQLQAYRRRLDFGGPDDSRVQKWSGELTPAQQHAFEDWMVHACCAQANERGWPHQVHVGTHNLEESGPLPLAGLAHRYPRQRIVMLHAWPFIEECGWLIKHLPNVYVDTCWQPVLNPMFLTMSLCAWLNYAPRTKVMCSQDATSIEMAAGSSLFNRELAGHTLATLGGGLVNDEAFLLETGKALLHNNAVNVYGIGEAV